MYKILGIALLGALVAMLLPAASDSVSNDDNPSFYGYAVMTLHDATGNVLFENSLHNEVVSVGSNFIFQQIFSDGEAPTGVDLSLVDAICINVNPRGMGLLFSATNESITLAEYTANDGDPANANLPCEGVTFTTTTAGGLGDASAVSTTATFNANSLALEDGETIVGIAIGDITDAAGDVAIETFLLALIDTSDVTVNVGETVDITYTLNLD